MLTTSTEKYRDIYYFLADKIADDMDPHRTYMPIKYYYSNRRYGPRGTISFDNPRQPCIYIYTLEGGEPIVSYQEDIFVLLHEYGHYKNVICTDPIVKSITGFEYIPVNKRKKHIVLKEEYTAWKNAFNYILKCKITGIDWLTRVYLCITFFFTAYPMYNTYKLYGKYDES